MIEALYLFLELQLSHALSLLDERTNYLFTQHPRKELTTSPPALVGTGTAAPSSLLSLSSRLCGWSPRGSWVSGLGLGRSIKRLPLYP